MHPVAEWILRTVLSGIIAILIYVVSAGIVARVCHRDVARSVLRHDIKLGFISLLFGSPVIQGLALLADRYHLGRMYQDIGQYGYFYWLISMPLYVMCWDAVFYLTHLVLHWPLVYRKSHFRHHSCRPPVAWSGIAIDPFETILSGIMPYVIPLFIFPFHMITVYALNIALMVWATLLHSTFRWPGNWLLLCPRDHNQHHAAGLKNTNFGAVFTLWDRLGHTLNRDSVPPWWGKAYWRPKAAPTTTTFVD